MDPREQRPARPQQRTQYISDFVPAPRQQTTQAGQPTPVATSAAPAVNGPRPTAPTLPATATPQLTRSGPSSSVTPQPKPAASTSSTGVRTNTEALSQKTISPNTAAAPHKSFALPEMPDIEPHETKAPKPHQGLRDVLSIFGVLASALVLAFCLISFVFQSYQVDGPSMQTTLQNNDHLIVWKVPKTIAKLTGKAYIPNRGDVMIFNEPGSAVGGVDKQLIKRVIALPGERVTVKDGEVTVYNKTYPNGFDPDHVLPYGVVIKETPGNVDITLKDNQVFAMGDNRTNSLDSRVFGPVNSSQIVGKLVLRVLPLNTVKKF